MALITDEEVRAIRPIAPNMNSGQRLDVYIDEATQLFVIPALGAEVVADMERDPDRYGVAMNGGYYDNDTKHCGGLRKALAYLAYSRFVMNQQVTVTSFGVTYKDGELSSRVDSRMLTYQANQAKEMGLALLAEVKAYLGSGACGCKPTAVRNHRYGVIGD